MSIDRACVKPPQRPANPEWQNAGSVHWDTNVSGGELRFDVQGVLYLSDTPAGAGGFQCIPGFPRRFEAWHAALSGAAAATAAPAAGGGGSSSSKGGTPAQLQVTQDLCNEKLKELAAAGESRAIPGKKQACSFF